MVGVSHIGKTVVVKPHKENCGWGKPHRENRSSC